MIRHFTKLCRLVHPWESASDPIYQGNANAARVVVTCAGSRARNANVRLNVRDLLAPFTHELDRPSRP